MIKIEYSVASSVGRVRDNNEDNFFADGTVLADFSGEPIYTSGTAEGSGLYAVCDGMGGAEYGEVASEIAVQTLGKYYKQSQSGDGFDKLCNLYVDEANAKICAKIENIGGLRMGTTLAILAVGGDAAKVYNIGDSRVYLLRDGKLTQVSKDHTQMRRMIELGILTPEKAKTHPERHKLTQHLGIFSNEMIIEPFVSSKISLENGDVFLLCSDGLTDMLEDVEIERIIAQNKTAEQAAQTLLNTALANGGKDNTTIITVRIEASKEGFWKKILS